MSHLKEDPKILMKEVAYKRIEDVKNSKTIKLEALLQSWWVNFGNFGDFYSSGKLIVRILSLRYSSSRRPKARR
ncbi:MAG: hypothetical protein PHW76_00370, partial [Alphaproteobacteria bacterium]|nr:hypothetical protein [Alphaproteobacteria bacterium]